LEEKPTLETKKQPTEVSSEESERTFIHWFDKPSVIKENKTNSSLIDDFLKTGKNKEKKHKEVFSPTNIAKLSLVSNTQFVTETLATIYAKQGQIDKAIEIYQQLSLKNPEKKTFFASRIRFLKEKQQYNK
jgi:pentatricopeptide repeat protein